MLGNGCFSLPLEGTRALQAAEYEGPAGKFLEKLTQPKLAAAIRALGQK